MRSAHSTQEDAEAKEVVDAVHREETLRVSECERVVTLVYPKTTGAALVPRLTEGPGVNLGVGVS
jgi:hypothetical protein